MMWHVYILEVSDGTYYTGITNNIEKRMEDHRNGKGSKYVRSRIPFHIVYQESVRNRSAATRRELEIKKMSRKNKEKLINGV
jgi:putative endonuclease